MYTHVQYRINHNITISWFGRLQVVVRYLGYNSCLFSCLYGREREREASTLQHMQRNKCTITLPGGLSPEGLASGCVRGE